MRKLFKYQTLIIIVLLLIAGCSTKKNTKYTRAYHNLTAHYNVYFNGHESYKEALITLKDKNEDDYTYILPTYIYPNQETRNALKTNLERAIEKCTKLIKLHSIKVKPKRPRRFKDKKQKEFYEKAEYCNWVDNGYMLMGKSFFYQAKYFQASTTFDFVVRKFPKEDVHYEALLWLLRTYNQSKEYEYSKEYIEILSKQKKIPKKYNSEIAVLKADYYIRINDYEKAIKNLEKCLRILKNQPLIKKLITTNKKHNIARYKFILGQLYEKTADDKKAYHYYVASNKHNAGYDLKFHSKLKIAEMDRSDPQKVYKMLLKMLKNDKNFDYKDRIYFSLGEIARKKNNRKKAVEYYKLASIHNTDNKNLKTKIFLTLANYYLEEKEYRNAGLYYDSTLNVMTDEYPNYKEIKSNASNYVNLARQLIVIEKQDSLLKLASMPKDAQKKWAQKIIKELRESEKAQKEEDARLQEESRLHQDISYDGRKTKGEWYFYNSYNVQNGKTQFKKKWGGRRLEDNWRRINKSIVNDFADVAEDEDEAKDSTKVVDKYAVEFYTQNIPSDTSSLSSAKEKLVDALYMVAFLYQDKIKSLPDAIATYEDIEKRNDNPDLAFVYYNLYKLHKQDNNISKSNHYRSLLLSDHPDTKYAKAIKDPEFLTKQRKLHKHIDSLYMDIFNDFAKQNWFQISAKLEDIKKFDLPDDLPEKIDFIEAITNGQTTGSVELRKNINDFMSSSSDVELKKLATTILNSIKSGAITKKADISKLRKESQILKEDSVRIEKVKLEAKDGYIFKSSIPHFYVMILPRKGVDYNRVKFNVANFNVDYFNRLPIDIETFEFDKKSLMIYVFKFDGKISALKYYNKLKEKEKLIFNKVNKIDYIHFVISENNYTRFVSDKFIGEYLEFFNEHYID